MNQKYLDTQMIRAPSARACPRTCTSERVNAPGALLGLELTCLLVQVLILLTHIRKVLRHPGHTIESLADRPRHVRHKSRSVYSCLNIKSTSSTLTQFPETIFR